MNAHSAGFIRALARRIFTGSKSAVGQTIASGQLTTVQQWTEQDEAIAAIEALGGRFDGQGTLSLAGAQITDAGLEHLKGLTGLERLFLRNTQVTDAGLEHLEGLTRLERLFLRNTQITDAGLKHLKGFTSLRWLSLAGTQITDVGLEYIKGLTSLRELHLDRTLITDAGLKHLKGFTSLRWLSLAGTQITNAVLEHLKRLTSLRELHLDRTLITYAGLEELRTAMPGCNVVSISNQYGSTDSEPQSRTDGTAGPAESVESGTGRTAMNLLQVYGEVSTQELQHTIEVAEQSLRETNSLVLSDLSLQQMIRDLMKSLDLTADVVRLCEDQPAEAQRIISAAIASLANGCTVQGVTEELNRRAEGN